jgi:proteic killer suppression protein
MIKDFKCKETEKIYNREYSKKLPHSIQRPAMKKLWILDASNTIEDLKTPPGNRLEPLKGKRDGQHSIRINDQYRICFRWHQGNAYEVEIADYH